MSSGLMIMWGGPISDGVDFVNERCHLPKGHLGYFSDRKVIDEFLEIDSAQEPGRIARWEGTERSILRATKTCANLRSGVEGIRTNWAVLTLNERRFLRRVCYPDPICHLAFLRALNGWPSGVM